MQDTEDEGHIVDYVIEFDLNTKREIAFGVCMVAIPLLLILLWRMLT